MVVPTATFVIPCYNHGPYVADAVASALAQADADVRVVVVDDGSDDAETPGRCDACAGERVRVVHAPRGGPARARNLGARGATSEYLVFLDADDVVDAGFVRRLDAALRAHDAAGAGARASHAFCWERITGKIEGVWSMPEWDDTLPLITNLHPVTVLLRREAFEAAGGFDESIEGYEDWELWIRLLLRGWSAVRVPEALFTWRRLTEDSQVMRDVSRHDRLYRQIIERHREAFLSRAPDLLEKTNGLLRKFDCNWLDQSGYPYSLIYLWMCRDELAALKPRAEVLAARAAEHEAAAGALAARVAELEAALAGERAERARERAMYESMRSVRLSRRLRRLLGGRPAPGGG